ncbi:MAG: EAL domain-containing protein [Acidobacteriota bacterium]|nr:EAL domain-containing protein [Acidobacteriota bacterium]
MTENPARSEAAVVEAAPGPRWFYTLELPALQLRAGEVTAANGRAVELFGDRVVGGAFDERFSALAHVAAPSKETGEGASRKVRALAGPAAGRRYALHRQAGQGHDEETILLLDVTRDSRLEEALTNRLREVNRAHRSGRLTSWELDLKRLRVTVPHRLPEAFGSVLRSLAFEEAMALFHPDSVGEVRNAVRRAIESGRLRLEVRVLDASGGEHWVLLRGATTKNAKGDPVTLSGVAIGITDETRGQNQVEEQLALQLALLDHLADGVVRMSADGTIVAINSSAERMTRWRSEEALGRPVQTVVHLVDDKTGERLRVQPEERGFEGSMNSRLIRRDGTELPVRCEIRKLMMPASDPAWVVEMRDLSELRGLESQMLFRATHDGLTGLFDRVEFERRLGEALADARGEQHTHALCYVDLDNFKIINDTCGHLAGDEMLKQIGSLLRCNFRGSDTLGRLGGDEFGILLTDCPLQKATDIAHSLCKDIKMFRFSWDDKVFNVTASVGLVSLDGQAASVAEVIGAADGACYIAKQKGANRVEIYRPDDSVLSERRDQLQLIQVVQNALATDTFELYGQPIEPLYSSERRIIELLLRMRDEQDRMVLPAEFMRVAEAHGLAVLIDRWVVRKALAELAVHGNAPGFAGVAFAINLSGQSLGDETFLQYVLEQFETSRVDPARVYFEITETAAISNLGRAMRFITELRGQGSVFVLDDFGAGLSSFGYLRNLPVGLIKIDGQFVKGLTRDPIQRALVEAINQIGQVMQMKTVAESVEDEPTLKALSAIKVDYAQGFHVARPAALSVLRERTR